MNKKNNIALKCYHVLGKVIDFTGIFLAAVMFILLAYQVFLRIFFSMGDVIANEIVTYSFIWIIYIGMIMATKDREHISVTMLPDRLSYRPRKILNIISNSLGLYFNIYIISNSLYLISMQQTLSSTSPIIKIPLYMLYYILPVSFFLSSIYVVRDIIENIRDFKSYEKKEKGGLE